MEKAAPNPYRWTGIPRACSTCKMEVIVYTTEYTPGETWPRVPDFKFCPFCGNEMSR